MSESVFSQAIELILSAMYRTRGDDGLESQFLFGPPGTPLWNRRLSTYVFFRRLLMVRAVLFVRQSGPAYLRSMSVRDIQSQLTSFITANYGHLGNETFLRKFECSYSEHVSKETKAALADALAGSSIFNPPLELTLFPLVPIRVEEDFHSSPFFLVQAKTLGDSKTGIGGLAGLDPEEFPPVSDWDGRKERPSAWLGIRSPIFQASNKMKAAILGALALTPLPAYRHQFSMRSMFGGRCTLDAHGGMTTSYSDAHTPGMSEDIVIRASDHAWLSMLPGKLSASDGQTRRQIRALEYFYRAWPLDAPERFPWLFMTLDAIFGDVGQATQAVIDAISKHGETNFEYPRLRLLLGLRNSVIHGGAPDVYESDKYHRYYETYGDDPLFDLERIAAQCLRSTIFEGTLVEHPDPNADIIRAYREGTLRNRKAAAPSGTNDADGTAPSAEK